MQEELELCKANRAQDQRKLQEEMEREKEKMAKERKRNKEAKEILERRVLKLNNDLSDARRELEERATPKSVQKHTRPTGHHPCTTGSSIVAATINNAVGRYSF